MVVALKLGFAVVFTLAMVAVYWLLENRPRLLDSIRPVYVLAFGIALRLLIFFAAFVVVGIPFGSDMQGVRYDFGKEIYDGKLPYVDVESDYAPFFQYLFVPAITDNYETSALGIAFICTVIECLSFFALWLLLNRSLPREQSLRWSILYVLCPLPYLFSIIGHQDETWLLGLYSLVLLMLLASNLNRQSRAVLAGIVLALGGLFTKSTSALPLGLMFGFTAVPGFFLVGLGIVGIAFVVLFVPVVPLMIAALTDPTWPDNPSIWYIGQILARDPYWVVDNNSIFALLTLAVTLLSGLAFAYLAHRLRLFERPRDQQIRYFLYTWIIVWLVFSLVTPKGLIDYTLFWIPAALFLFVVQPSTFYRAVVVAFCLIVSVHSSLSYRLLPVERYYDLTNRNQMFMLMLDALVYVVYVVVLWYTVRQLRAEFLRSRS